MSNFIAVLKGKMMNNRILIKSIHIINFRSIRNININLLNMNVFVGLNDVGKSNVLKALNLFFNNKADYDSEFDFQRDFSYLFPEKSHSAKEITIVLEFDVPSSFRNSGIYTWKKVWRRTGLAVDSILDKDGNTTPTRSRIPITLRRIKFRYVPAVKSKEYYKYLLSELFLTAAASLNSPLVNSTQDFVKVIQNYTEQIHDEVNNRIGIESRLTIPSDMTDMFKTLIFMTNGKEDGVSVPLDMRGDGIQARHIPIILKYLADEDQKTRNQGSSKITSIWGYEEPENGIELLKTYELADSFREYSEQIQLFITTHSPAFYKREEQEDYKIFYVSKDSKNETTISDSINLAEIGETMGLMPLVAPYIADKEKELKERLKQAKDELLYDIPTIFVEGKTDKIYIELAIREFSTQLTEMLDNNQLKLFSKEAEGGCKQISNWVHAWIYKGNKSRTLALYDKDEAGEKAHCDLVSSPLFKQSQNNKAAFLEPSQQIKDIFSKNIRIAYEIEHLLSSSCWGKIKEAGYAAQRSTIEINKMLGELVDKNRTTMEILSDIVKDTDLRDTILLYEPAGDKKENIVNLVLSASAEERKEYIDGFRNLVKLLEKRFL